jgi:wobble nucleotide-excising tRNase
MISKINTLKNFGIYKNFSWNGLDNFKKKNLIYGWNYSGKTTLSKLFQGIKHREKHWVFPTSEFEITTEKNGINTSYKKNDLESFPFDIKVFNSQYIKDVFISDDMDLDINPISFYLGDPSGQLVEKIKELDSKEKQLVNIRDNRYQKILNKFSKYDKKTGSKFTDKAKEIRDNYLDGKLTRDDFNISHFRKITINVKSNLEKFILPDSERDITKSEATIENTFDIQKEDFSISENLEGLKKEVKNILEATAPKSISIPELDNDKDLFNWVQTGIKLHKNETECNFCTKTLPENRINDLNSYYSEKLQEIQKEITDTQKKIKSEREKLKITFIDKKYLKNNYQEDYQNAVDNFNEIANKYNIQLTVLEQDLKRKTSDFFTNIPATEIDNITLSGELVEINKSVKAHNKWLEEFDKNKEKAIKKILNHYVAKYLQTEKYNDKEANKERASIIINTINAKISTNKSERLILEADLKSNVKGQEELNSILEILLHRKDIRIEIENDKFTLVRGDYQANNLSEGEKSAVAFAYFLTEIKSLRYEDTPKLPNTIVYIDDPISSLDSNHIFQIRSLINSFFNNCPLSKTQFDSLNLDKDKLWINLIDNGYINNKGIIQEQFNSIKNNTELILDTEFENKRVAIYNELKSPIDFAQLFISTHNFEFFSVMRDTKLFGNIRNNAKEEKRPFYWIRRADTNSSIIEKLPKTFSEHKSEYVGIFNILLEYHNSVTKEQFPYIILLPNALRRFVELYTLSKYPANNSSTLDTRVELVFNPQDKAHHNTKLLNWFSHQNQLEKLQQHDDKILQIDDAIKDLIDYIKENDRLHWKGLTDE